MEIDSAILKMQVLQISHTSLFFLFLVYLVVAIGILISLTGTKKKVSIPNEIDEVA